MRQMKTFRHSTLRPALIAVTLSMLLISCSLMKDDRSDCPACRNPLHVKLRYDYNIQRANMFSDHVEEATVTARCISLTRSNMTTRRPMVSCVIMPTT